MWFIIPILPNPSDADRQPWQHCPHSFSSWFVLLCFSVCLSSFYAFKSFYPFNKPNILLRCEIISPASSNVSHGSEKRLLTSVLLPGNESGQNKADHFPDKKMAYNSTEYLHQVSENGNTNFILLPDLHCWCLIQYESKKAAAQS